jgi:hypothetical protein
MIRTEASRSSKFMKVFKKMNFVFPILKEEKNVWFVVFCIYRMVTSFFIVWGVCLSIIKKVKGLFYVRKKRQWQKRSSRKLFTNTIEIKSRLCHAIIFSQICGFLVFFYKISVLFFFGNFTFFQVFPEEKNVIEHWMSSFYIMAILEDEIKCVVEQRKKPNCKQLKNNFFLPDESKKTILRYVTLPQGLSHLYACYWTGVSCIVSSYKEVISRFENLYDDEHFHYEGCEECHLADGVERCKHILIGELARDEFVEFASEPDDIGFSFERHEVRKSKRKRQG